MNKSQMGKQIRWLDGALKELEAEVAAKQAKIDELMLEYCPDEMTPEQIEEWGRNQRPVAVSENPTHLQCDKCGRMSIVSIDKPRRCCRVGSAGETCAGRMQPHTEYRIVKSTGEPK